MIEVQHVSNFILQDINLSVQQGELFVLLGPNGAGKTTFLNALAGLCEYTGSITMFNTPMEHIPPEKREIGYLFQHLCLFPHMTVYENIAFGLKARKMEYKKRVEELLDFLHLSKFAQMYPATLSGGEKQKVALLRALAIHAKVILMDEPFNNLDLATTKYLRMEFKHIIKRFHITSFFVTHNIKEAIELADRIAIMIQGRIHQVGTPDEVFFSPQNDEVLSFVGTPNIFQCDASTYLGDGLSEVTCGGLHIVVPTDHKHEIKKVVILPENIYVSSQQPPGPHINHYQGKIVNIIVKNSMYNIEVMVHNKIIHCHTSEKIFDASLLQTGENVCLIFPLKWLKWV